ncbi:MAG: hypothetical protein DRJ52_09800 [Thermoprotei archaeon]|nr:MAG: hypothetical protein DRJ52_09800 [Thermoprotei archaeon]
MEVSLQKLVLVASVAAVVAAVIAAYRPWESAVAYQIEYLRKKAVEVAEAIDSKSPVRLTEDWSLLNRSLLLEITRPNEKSVTIKLNYSVLAVPSPQYLRITVKGRPDKEYSLSVRETFVYFNGSLLIIDPKPVVQYCKILEYGRVVHVVKVVLFKINGSLWPGCTLRYVCSATYTATRTYDYTGTSVVTVGGQEALRFRVKAKEILKVVLVEERWESG